MSRKTERLLDKLYPPTLQPFNFPKNDDEIISFWIETDVYTMLEQPTYNARGRGSRLYRKKRPILIINDRKFRYDKITIYNPNGMNPMFATAAITSKYPTSIAPPPMFIIIGRNNESIRFRLIAPFYEFSERTKSGRGVLRAYVNEDSKKITPRETKKRKKQSPLA